jgi:hypothetical protein
MRLSYLVLGCVLGVAGLLAGRSIQSARHDRLPPGPR